VLRALRPALTSEQVDQIVVVDDRAATPARRIPRDSTLTVQSLGGVSPVRAMAQHS
jgi:hypothetical protein